MLIAFAILNVQASESEWLEVSEDDDDENDDTEDEESNSGSDSDGTEDDDDADNDTRVNFLHSSHTMQITILFSYSASLSFL